MKTKCEKNILQTKRGKYAFLYFTDRVPNKSLTSKRRKRENCLDNKFRDFKFDESTLVKISRFANKTTCFKEHNHQMQLQWA